MESNSNHNNSYNKELDMLSSEVYSSQINNQTQIKSFSYQRASPNYDSFRANPNQLSTYESYKSNLKSSPQKQNEFLSTQITEISALKKENLHL